MSKKFTILLVLLLAVAALSVWNLLEPYPTTGFSHSWEMAVPQQPVPEGLQSLSAAACGRCHSEHYQEWRISTHALAWVDPQFQAELAKDNSPYLCINCHTPLQNQQPEVVTGLIDGDVFKPIKHANPGFDPALQQEGITCAACHVRNGRVLAREVSGRAPHASGADPQHLSEQLCIGCHNATAVVTPDLVCTFETADEWRAGPYYGQKTCIDCHMPQVSRSRGDSLPPAAGRLHYFMGSGIPKHDTLTTERLDGLVYDLGGIRAEYPSGDTLTLSVVVANKLAGHKVPTGDPERFIITRVRVYELTSGTLVQEDTFRIGERWVWYPEARKIADNNLPPGESRQYEVRLWLPPGTYKAEVKAWKYRTTEEMVRYNKLGEHYPTHILFFEQSRTFRVGAPLE